MVKYRQSSISHWQFRRFRGRPLEMTENARVIAEQDNAPVNDEGQP